MQKYYVSQICYHFNHNWELKERTYACIKRSTLFVAGHFVRSLLNWKTNRDMCGCKHITLSNMKKSTRCGLTTDLCGLCNYGAYINCTITIGILWMLVEWLPSIPRRLFPKYLMTRQFGWVIMKGLDFWKICGVMLMPFIHDLVVSS